MSRAAGTGAPPLARLRALRGPGGAVWRPASVGRASRAPWPGSPPGREWVVLRREVSCRVALHRAVWADELPEAIAALSVPIATGAVPPGTDCEINFGGLTNENEDLILST